VKDIKILTKIPVLPISYHDALPLLKSLSGPVAPDNWKGALPITYHVGPGLTKVHLKVESNWDIKPIHDVIAMIKGSEFPDQWVIRGNHHDGWVNGAEDPLSGQVAEMEEGKAIGELLKTGWRPKRTIVYCAWDGEEPGLLGSTEWCETHADELKQKAVAYINSDSNDRGFLFMDGSHSLETFINNVAKDVTDPEKGISVWERARDRQIINTTSPERKRELESAKNLEIGAMGSGSDYTPFLQHLGIACLDLGFGGEGEGGVYHSAYDSYDHYIRFGDPTFEYGIALSKTAGRAVLRLADDNILPFNFDDFAGRVSTYLNQIEKLTKDMREETNQLNLELKDSLFTEASDPTKTYIPPKPEDPVPYLNFAPLENAVNTLQKSADEYQKAKNELIKSGKKLSEEQEKTIDQLIYQSERYLTNKEGLTGRPWYVHEIYAPGFYTGYGVKTLPAVREAVESRNWDEANKQTVVVANTLNNYSADLDQATKIMKEFMK
jgi:N-acetylated-alpha-linked acidic dipeptidase